MNPGDNMGDNEKVVFDCPVYAPALINPKGPAAACIAHAQSGHIKLIVSRDRHLLNLMDGGRKEGKDFTARFPELLITTPDVLAAQLRATKIEGAE